jgi:glucokinase
MDEKKIIIKEPNGVIAVDVGGTQLRAAFFLDGGIEPLKLIVINTKAPGENPLNRLISLINSVWPEQETVTCIAIGVPGPLDPRTGIVNCAPNIDNWEELPLVEIIQSEFNTPCRIGNDANLAALGEWKYGAGIGHSNLLYFTISTGIGGGIISGGELLVGSFGLAGEVGHIKVMQNGPMCGCGKTGHLEAVASGTGIANYLSEQLASGRNSILGKNPSAHDAAEAAKKGDALSIEAFERAGSFLGQGIASMLHLFNPSIIVLGGGVIKAGDLLLKPFRKSLESEIISPAYLQNLKIEIAKLGDQVVLIGALVLART